MSDTPEGNICKVSANLGWASDTLAEVDKALLKLSAEVKTILCARDEWKAKFIQANKDYGFELRDPCGTIWDHAKRLQQERDEALEALREIAAADWKTSGELRGMARQALEASK